MVKPVLHQDLFRNVFSGKAPISSTSHISKHQQRNLRRVEFDWAPDGSLLAVREYVICPICGVEFRPVKKAHQYCSNRCGNKAWKLKRKKLLLPIVCRICGVTFTPRRQGHDLCSGKCQSKAWRLDHPKKIQSEPTACACCGVIFMPNNYDARFCSESCQQKVWYKKNKDRKLKTNTAWRKKNPVKVKKWGDDWRRKNPEKIRHYQHITEIRRKNTAIVCKDGVLHDPGTSLNLSTKLVGGQERVIEMVRLERHIDRLKNSPFRKATASESFNSYRGSGMTFS